MNSPVLELQRAAYDQKEAVSVLLSKAYILSRKLKIDEFSKWASNELNGYKDEEEVPDYRVVHGQLKAYNPSRGQYIPAYFQTEIEDLMNKRAIRSILAEVESLAEKGQEGGMLTFKFPPAAQRLLMEKSGYELEISLHIPVNYFERIREKVRSVILEWTLQLEEEGVYGEGMSFSKQEKEKAITPSVTIIGTMINSQYQQNTEGSTQTLRIEEFQVEKLYSLIDKLHELKKEMKDPVTQEELAAEVQVLESQTKSPNPKKGIIRETLLSIKNIAEGTTGSLVATGIQEEVVKLLKTLPLL